MMRWLAFLLCLIASPATAQVVNIGCNQAAPNDIGTAITNNPAGTTFSLAANCTYTLPVQGQIHPKNNDVFQGNCHGQVPAGSTAPGCAITTAFDGGGISAILFNGSPFGDNTTGVTFDGVRFQNWGSNAVNSTDPVGYLGNGWIITNSECKNSGGVCFNTTVGATISNSYIHDNMAIGIVGSNFGGGATGRMTIIGNEVASNNDRSSFPVATPTGTPANGSTSIMAVSNTTNMVDGGFIIDVTHPSCLPGPLNNAAHKIASHTANSITLVAAAGTTCAVGDTLSWSYPDDNQDVSAAGMKISPNAVPIDIKYNYVHDNHATGIWCDAAGQHWTVQGNTVINNYYHGIMFETCFFADISRNVVNGNGLSQGAFADGNQIFISSADGAYVHDNNLSVPNAAGGSTPRAILVQNQSRSDTAGGGNHIVKGNVVTFNGVAGLEGLYQQAIPGAVGVAVVSPGAQNNGSGLCRLTITAAGQQSFFFGSTVRVSGIVGATACNGTFTVGFGSGIAYNQIDLVGSTFSGTWTSGGIVNGDGLPSGNVQDGNKYCFNNASDTISGGHFIYPSPLASNNLLSGVSLQTNQISSGQDQHSVLMQTIPTDCHFTPTCLGPGCTGSGYPN